MLKESRNHERNDFRFANWRNKVELYGAKIRLYFIPRPINHLIQDQITYYDRTIISDIKISKIGYLRGCQRTHIGLFGKPLVLHMNSAVHYHIMSWPAPHIWPNHSISTTWSELPQHPIYQWHRLQDCNATKDSQRRSRSTWSPYPGVI